MKSTYRYALGKANRHKKIIKVIEDYRFEKGAEAFSAMASAGELFHLLDNQIKTLDKRNYVFEMYSYKYLNEEYISIEEAFLLTIGYNPDVLSHSYFRTFNLKENQDGLLEALFINRINEYKILDRNVFQGLTLEKTEKFIKFAIENNYVTRKLSTPKTANYKNQVKEKNLLITRKGLVKLLKSSNKTRNKSYYATKLYEHIQDELIPINNNGDIPSLETIRKYISEITLSEDWKLIPESIKDMIK